MKTIHIIPTLEDNYTYAIVTGQEAVLIDCGEAQPVIDYLSKLGVTPTDILCTHHHNDHIDGIPGLEARYPDLKVHVPEGDISRIPGHQNGLHNLQTLTFADYTVECLWTPGHTKNHLCYHIPHYSVVLTGDALFSMGCGRLFEGDAEDLLDSMLTLKKLPDETRVYCGHEYTLKNLEFSLTIEPSNPALLQKLEQVKQLRSEGKPTLPVTMGEEKKNNLFLKANTVEKIAQLRQLRDKF